MMVVPGSMPNIIFSCAKFLGFQNIIVCLKFLRLPSGKVQGNLCNLALMLALSHKSKQYGLIALKVLVLSLTFGYIYLKLTQQESISFSQFASTIQYKNGYYILLFLGLAATNWAFEILKWQTVIFPVKKLTFWEAARQSLAALTVSLSTPNRIGDYGAKAYFFEAGKRKQVLLLNFFSHLSQMAITVIFGAWGLIYVVDSFGLSFSTTNIIVGLCVLLFFGIIGYVFKEKQLLIKGLSLVKMNKFIKNLSTALKLKTLLYSLVRYLIFSSLFYLLLKFFGAGIALSEAMPIIFAMYLLVSVVPTIFIFDVVVRGGIAVWLFSLAGILEWPILYAVMAMWLLNFVIPAIWGSFYVLTYRKV